LTDTAAGAAAAGGAAAGAAAAAITVPAAAVIRYAWEALVINELSGLDLFLSAPGVSLSLPVKGQVFLQVSGVGFR
jgi:hypothetical protein